MDINNLTIEKIHEGLKQKDFSAVEITKEYLRQIEKSDHEIGAFLFVARDSAMEEAKKIDKRISEKQDLPVLAGVPCAIKDIILVEGQKCTAASKILENYVAPYDATVTKKLREQRAVILGKTNCDEFAMGSSTQTSAFKITKNPCDLERVPGGSSGGSAAAVAADMACYSLGTDTGGSIRQPASFCGIVGLCPTYGAVSRYGVIAHASSLDQVGPMAKTAKDCELVFRAISGKDNLDATSNDLPKINYEMMSLKNLKIGIPKEYFAEGLDPEVEKIIKKTITKAEKAGAEIVDISLPTSEFALACYYIIDPSEISANLARFDGIKYGLSENKGEGLLDVYLNTRGRGFGPEVKRRIMLGTYSLSSGYYDAYYKKAQKVRELIRQDFAKAFEKVDVLFTPVSPFPAFKIGEKMDNPMSMYLADIYTVPLKLAGLPGLSLPVGKIGNLPVGLQIIGKHFEDYKVLKTAELVEQLQ